MAAGICCGNPDRKLEVISEADDEQIGLIDKFLDSAEISVAKSDANNSFDIQVRFMKKITVHMFVLSVIIQMLFTLKKR